MAKLPQIITLWDLGQGVIVLAGCGLSNAPTRPQLSRRIIGYGTCQGPNIAPRK